MTEKQYGGSTNFGVKSTSSSNSKKNASKLINNSNKSKEEYNSEIDLNEEQIEKLKLSGRIALETIAFARNFIKKDMSLLEIAEKIEKKIIDLGGKPAFPVNLSINEIAAHSTPSYNDSELASGLLKVDLGVHIDGFVADTAFSLDLDNNDENKKLILAAETALKKASEKFSKTAKIREIGKIIQDEIESFGFQPVSNLSGHSIEQYTLHAGITVPNYDNSQENLIKPGVYAIEPFSTNGLGAVRDGKLSGIYHLEKEGTVRDSFAREVLEFIREEYGTLPFCSRWIYKKFSSRGLLAIRRIEEAGLVHHYPQLVETGKGKVAQAENTIILTDEKKIITTSQF